LDSKKCEKEGAKIPCPVDSISDPTRSGATPQAMGELSDGVVANRVRGSDLKGNAGQNVSDNVSDQDAAFVSALGFVLPSLTGWMKPQDAV